MPVRSGHYALSRSQQVLVALGAVPIGAIGPNELQQWINQMVFGGWDHATLRA